MGKYLDILKQAGLYDKNDINDKSPPPTTPLPPFGRISRFGRTLSALEARCPDHVPPGRWEKAVADGRRFLATWGSQAEAMGWTAADLFGLHTPPAKPHPSYNRLSRYDCSGLVWLLQGRPVVALTETTASIRNPTGTITTYRRYNKPSYRPLGDSLDDFH
jgi:hypothetical protein